MIEKGHPIDGFFTEELEHLEIIPPESIWNGIEEKLDQKRKKRVILLWYRLGWAAGVALFIGLFSTLYVTSNKNKISHVFYTSVKQKTLINKSQDSSDIRSAISVQSVRNTISTANEREIVNTRSGNIFSNNNKSTEEFHIATTVANKKERSNITPDNLTYLHLRTATIPSNNGYEQAYNAINDYINKNTAKTTLFGPEKEIAQEPTITKKHKWSFEGEFAPTYAYRDINSVNGSSSSNSDYNNNESGLIAWSAGFKLNYTTSPKLSLQFGLYYSLMGQVLNNIYRSTPSIDDYSSLSYSKNASFIDNSLGTITNSETNNNPNNTAIYPSYSSLNNSYFTSNKSNETLLANDKITSSYEKIDAKLIFKLHYIEIPLIVRYRLVDRKFKWHVLGGINTGILFKTGASLKASDSEENFGTISGLRRINYNAIAGFGFLFPVRSNINFLLEPTFKYNIRSVSSNDQNNVHLYSFNLYTGFSLNL